MLKCLREEITSGGCLSKQVPNAKLMAFIFLKKDSILEEIEHQRKRACHVFQMHHFTHSTNTFFLVLFLGEICPR